MARGLILHGSRQAISREAAGAGLLGAPLPAPQVPPPLRVGRQKVREFHEHV